MKKTTKKQVKKSTKKVVRKHAKKAVAHRVAVLVKPAASYTKDEVRSILGLSKMSNLSPSKYAGMGGKGKVPGSVVIARLERISTKKGRGRPSRVKIGRRYASGTVTVVAR